MRRIKHIGAPLALYGFLLHLLLPVASALAVDQGARDTLLVICGVEGLRTIPLDPDPAPDPDGGAATPEASAPSFCLAGWAGCGALLAGSAPAGPAAPAMAVATGFVAATAGPLAAFRSPIRSARGPPNVQAYS